MLARLQKFLTLLVFGSAALIATITAMAGHPWLSVVWALAIVFSYAVVLAAEFVMLFHVQRQTQATPPVGALTLLRAWAWEVLTTPRIFFWRQPFFPDLEPDHVPTDTGGRRGVVLVHGMVCNRGFWTPWMSRLRRQGIPFVAVNLEPVFGSIDDYAVQIEGAVRRIESSGLPVVLVGHSLGGIAIRAWLRAYGAEQRIHRIVTIASPHQGTWLARFSRATNGRQVLMQSPWLHELAATETPSLRARFTCFYGDCDAIVFPADRAMLPGARNLFVHGIAHVRMAFEQQVFDEVSAWLEVPPDGQSTADQSTRSVEMR